MKKRALTTAIVAAMMMSLFASCANKPAGVPAPADQSKAESAGQDTPPSAEGDQTVTVISTNGAEKTFHKDLAPIFEEENPGIKINFIETPFEQFDTKIQTMLASGTPLDTASHNGWMGFGSRLANDQLLPLDDLMEQNSFRIEGANIPENAAAPWIIDGTTYGIPVHIFPTYLMYNKDMFDAAGIDYPPSDYADTNWTYDKMIDIAKQLSKDVDDIAKAQYGLVFNWHVGGYEQLPQYFGESTFDEDTFTKNGGFATTAYFDKPENIEIYQKVADLIHVDKVSPSTAATEAMGNNAFYAGKAGMYVDGGWALSGINDLPFNVGVAAVPNGGNDKVRSIMWIDPYWIFKDSKAADATFKYIQFLTRTDIQEKIVELSGGIPPANMEAFGTYTSFFKGIEPKDLEAAFNGGVEYGFEGMSHLMPDAGALNTLLTNEMGAIFNEGKSAKDMMPGVQKSVTDFIQKTNEKYKK